MQSRTGFARLMPLAVLTGLVAGTVALLASARSVQAPVSVRAPVGAADVCAECSEELPPPSPSAGIRDARGKLWSLAELKPGTVLEGADLPRAQWHGVSLPGVIFVHCDFRGAELDMANLRGAHFLRCDFRESDSLFYGADLTGAVYDAATRWYEGYGEPPRHASFNPDWAGARLERSAPSSHRRRRSYALSR